METSLAAAVRSLVDLYPAVRVGALGAAVAVAACTAGHAADVSAVETYRQGLAKIVAVSSPDHAANVKAMRDVAKSTLLSAKSRHLDVDAPGDLDAATAAYFRQRLRGALYVDTAGLSPAQADDRVKGIAKEALAKGGARGAAARPAAGKVQVASLLPEASAAAKPVAVGTGYVPASARSPGMAADISQPATRPFLAKMREMGVKTIIRYYDHIDETIRNKTLHAAERDLITSSGFDVAVVFQHHNDQIASFTPQRGRADALRSLDLAVENRQPQGRMIYFGVDNDWARPGDVAKVRDYFVAVNEALKGKGYGIGVYGSGAACKALMAEGLAKNCWLAQSKGYSGYKSFLASKEWSVLQHGQQRLGGLDVDLDSVNEAKADFGQFGL